MARRGTLTVLAILGAFALAITALAFTMGDAEHELGFRRHEWLQVGSLEISLGLMMDALTAVMVVVVTGVSLLVQVYGTEYMRGDAGYTRYFAYMAFFTAAMLGLVMVDNLVLIYVFWELVGLASYLLIGFWSAGKAAEEHPKAADAAKKAFLVTRLGDVGLLAAIVWAWVATGTLEVEGVFSAVETGALTGAGLTWLAVGIFSGAMGKSGQFPLHVWLPDAMEGPTPVSALIHAATMVAAGVFLVARLFPIFEHSTDALTLVSWIGGFTAIFAASMALVANDIKRVLAFSTISQLGYMMLALGMGAVGAAIFHLFTHAFFKALLFLGAGSVHHAVRTYDMRYMGGLGRRMPWTVATMTVGALALVGIFPLAGFWSKDAILGATDANHLISGATALFWFGTVAAGLTGFYALRMLFLTFAGEYRGGAEAEAAGRPPEPVPAARQPHLHESPAIMVAPLAVLAVAAVAGGLADLPWDTLGLDASALTAFLGGEAEGFSVRVATLTSVAGGIGVVLAYAMYVQRVPSPARVAAALWPAYHVLANRYYLDYLYERVLVERVFYTGIGIVTEIAEGQLVDRVVNWTGEVGRNLGRVPSALQSGQVQVYGAVISVGVVLILAGFWIWG